MTAVIQTPATATAASADDALWYKDAVIYELHVKAFYDGNGDGIGDFAGLRTKLDYLQDLGVTALWLLPFYPSPLKDDGYDISDYREVHPSYGTMRDFRQFVREAHRRGLKVITELVINHTSDQHPWFQRARRARSGSAARNMYLWSDTDKALAGTRIIFSDTESSNWTWDAQANAYYWHRFFSHQPDLNHNNPRVVHAVSQVMRYWFDMGVDGMRLDAIPYLCVREGTNNENLPETHAVIRQLRAVVDRHYRNRMLLAEANQWPEDVREYFGQGDECHMAYHFPLMPRMYMALALEDRYPIVEIMEQTPDIPANCQWAIFLRNHDELTLEMVTDRERDYMYQMYANEPRMRVNVGIRRRLAPLLENDQDRIRLLNGLLMSMPGTPIIYYGDEIGMGDNVFLGDRNGVRTPMQWSPDRNAGFSRADPQRLYLPAIMDPIYGYEAVNVEAQQRDRSSLLNWMKRMLAVRRQHHAFGRGTLEFIRPGNRKILCYVRAHGEEIILCVANLARSAQAVELDLGRFRGRVPIELLGRTPFPPIGELPYLLTLPGQAYYWFLLSAQAEAPSWHREVLPQRELPVLVLPQGLDSLLAAGAAAQSADARAREQFERNVLPAFLATQRWFAQKSQALRAVRLARAVDWRSPLGRWLLCFVEIELEDGARRQYFVPLGLVWEGSTQEAEIEAGAVIAKVRQRAQPGRLVDAFADAQFCRAMIAALGETAVLEAGEGAIRFLPTQAWAALASEASLEPVRPAGAGSSNTGVLIGERFFLKGYRQLRAGINPELEMGRFLTETAHYPAIAPLAGEVVLEEQGERRAMCALQGFVRNQGDAWTYTLDYLARFLAAPRAEGPAAGQDHALYLAQIRKLGLRTGELHRALARSSGQPDFDPEPIEARDLQRWTKSAAGELRATLAQLRGARGKLPEAYRPLADDLLGRAKRLTSLLTLPDASRLGAARTRYHGDFHLGQALVVRDDFVIIDFEGEPARSIEERRAKHSPLRDVAGMLRSFAYAAAAALGRAAESAGSELATQAEALEGWRSDSNAAFLEGYREGVADAPSWPRDAEGARQLIAFFQVEKALYELRYELDNRPAWAVIPMRGLIELASGGSGSGLYQRLPPPPPPS